MRIMQHNSLTNEQTLIAGTVRFYLTSTSYIEVQPAKHNSKRIEIRASGSVRTGTLVVKPIVSNVIEVGTETL